MTLRGRAGCLIVSMACASLLLASAAASGASLVGKDGKIHACYKATGRGKGTLRVVRNGKVKCPKRWKKVSWYASGSAGPQGQAGAPGSPGETGTNGGSGLPGTTGTVTVKALEDKLTELLNRVQSLETILSGIDNQQLKEAIAAAADVKALEATVGSLCSQGSALTAKSGELGTALGGLSAVLDTLTVLALPSIPTALPAFSCP
jgi:hypothetical protein